MAMMPQEVDLTNLSQTVREARRGKGWTLEQLSHELWERGFPTAQNKLWRLENRPPKRLDSELLLWLEKVLEVELIESGDKKQVLIEDVLELVDRFVEASETGAFPETPANRGLQLLYDKLIVITNSTAG